MVYIARLWSSGFELQSVTSGVECDTITGSPTIDTTIKRSGGASLRCNPTAAAWYIRHQFTGTALGVNDEIYVRFYIYIATATNGTEDILRIGTSGYPADPDVYLRLTSGNKLQLGVTDGGGGFLQVGSDSSALNTGQWYRIEIGASAEGNASADRYLELLIDGSSIALTTTGEMYNGDDLQFLQLGIITSSTCDIYFDDIAVNDSTGASQTSFPGAGSIVHMQVDGNGDVQEQNAGDWDEIEDVTPDDGTYIELDDNDDDVLFTLESSSNAGITAGSTINVVQVGYRHRPETAAAAGFTPYLEGTTAGTKQNGTAFTHNDITWKTNGDALPRTYKLTSYTNPQDSAAWETSDLDTMQIGGICTDADPDFYISSMWALVEYVPAVAPATTISFRRTLLGVGI